VLGHMLQLVREGRVEAGDDKPGVRTRYSRVA